MPEGRRRNSDSARAVHADSTSRLPEIFQDLGSVELRQAKGVDLSRIPGPTGSLLLHNRIAKATKTKSRDTSEPPLL